MPDRISAVIRHADSQSRRKEAKIWFKDSEDNADSGKATFVSDKGGIVYASVENLPLDRAI